MKFLAFLVCLIGLLALPVTTEANDLFDYLFGKPTLEVEWTFATGRFDEGAAEIVAYDSGLNRVFVTNGDLQAIQVLHGTDGTDAGTISLVGIGEPTSVAVKDGLVAIAADSGTVGVPGKVVFADGASLAILGSATVGFLPDMVTFTPDGRKVLVACEGEPNDDYTLDPEGSVAIVTVNNGTDPTVLLAGFQQFNPRKAELQAAGVRIFGPGATVAQDLEPEYIAVTPNSKTAYVTCQENNAIAVVNLVKGEVTSIAPLGFKDHSQSRNAMDASNRDDAINIQPWPTRGMYQPDSIASFRFLGIDLVVTANEGDARDYEGFSEEERVADLMLDSTAFPNAATLQRDENLGRLNATTANGDTDGDGDFDEIFSYGARSFSIWRISRGGRAYQVYDSGDDFEQITAAQFPLDFNSTNSENDSFDNRSDDKGPEPEALTIGTDLFQTYSLIGLERIGGIMVYEITNPFAPRFIEYTNNRDFRGDAEAGTAGDLAPEGIVFVPRGQSPFVEPAVIVANEVSGSTTLYRVKRVGGILSDRFNE